MRWAADGAASWTDVGPVDLIHGDRPGTRHMSDWFDPIRSFPRIPRQMSDWLDLGRKQPGYGPTVSTCDGPPATQAPAARSTLADPVRGGGAAALVVSAGTTSVQEPERTVELETAEPGERLARGTLGQSHTVLIRAPR